MTMIGIIVQVGTTLDAEAQTVIPAQGLEWQIENHLVTEQRLEVDEIALQVGLRRSSSCSTPG